MAHKQEKRKGFEWYRMLTKKQQKQFRKNFISEEKLFSFCFIMNRAIKYVDFIQCSFSFKNTPQGHDYWWRISKLNK